MSAGVFQSDLDFALRLLKAGCEDPSIVACLCWRGLPQEHAEQVVRDLRCGRLVPVCVPTSEGSELHPETQRQRASLPRHRHHHRLYSCRSLLRRAFAGFTAASAVVIVALSVGYVGYETWQAALANHELMWDRNPGLKQRCDRYDRGGKDPGYDRLRSSLGFRTIDDYRENLGR